MKIKQSAVALVAVTGVAVTLVLMGFILVEPALTQTTDNPSPEQLTASRCIESELLLQPARIEDDTVVLAWSADYFGAFDWKDSYRTVYRIDRTPAHNSTFQDQVGLLYDEFTLAVPTPPGEYHFQVGIIGTVIDGVNWSCPDVGALWQSITVVVERPLTMDERETFVDSLCAWTSVDLLEARYEDTVVNLNWHVADEFLHHSRHQWQYYPDYVFDYQIQKRRANDDNGQWENVADVTDKKRWGASSEPGDWEYRVALANIIIEDQELPCLGDRVWATAEVRVPTAQEIAEEEAQRTILTRQVMSCQIKALTGNIGEEARPIIVDYIEQTTQYRVDRIKDFGSLVQFVMDGCATQ